MKTANSARGMPDLQLHSDEKEIISEIVETVVSYLHPARIILFGSRAIGRASRYSDFDIAVENVELDIRKERRLRETLEDRLGIYMVDVIDLARVDLDFKKLILETGRVIYEN
jgi:predicted nucleotidyltransferase